MITYHREFKQGDPEWIDIRAGRLTASEAIAIVANGKNGNLSAGAVSLAYKKAAERITGPELFSFVSADMKRGTDLEPVARERYEEVMFTSVDQVGFVSIGDWIGYSPDGLVGEEGLIEIKCPNGPEYVRYCFEKTIDRSHLAQMQFGMWVTGRKWCDYVVFNPEFSKNIQIERIEQNEAFFELFNARVTQWVDLVEDILRSVR